MSCYALDARTKLKHTIDALFGAGVSRMLPSDISITHAKKNSRIRSVYHKGSLLCTLRIDGGLAITPSFAQLLLKSRKFLQNCIDIDDDSEPFVSQGKSVFCGHVLRCGDNIAAGSDVAVLHRGRVVAVGKAVLPCSMIRTMNRGVAVRVRDTLKTAA